MYGKLTYSDCWLMFCKGVFIFIFRLCMLRVVCHIPIQCKLKRDVCYKLNKKSKFSERRYNKFLAQMRISFFYVFLRYNKWCRNIWYIVFNASWARIIFKYNFVIKANKLISTKINLCATFHHNFHVKTNFQEQCYFFLMGNILQRNDNDSFTM